MASELKVSRGSFYWHFRNISDFRAEILRSWAESTTDEISRDLERMEQSAAERLSGLTRRAVDAKPDLDRAIRAWAAEDETVAREVAAVDRKRLAYVKELLLAAGVAEEDVSHRAAVLYWALLGQLFVMDPEQSRLAAAAIDDLRSLITG
jgi:AcrR family transcriptional regulator